MPPTRFRILDAGLVPSLLPRGRLSCGDHLLGLAQPFTSFRERDAPNTIAAEGNRLLSTVDQIVVAERDRPSGRNSHVKAVAVVHLIKFVLRLEVAQLGISQHGLCSSGFKIPC